MKSLSLLMFTILILGCGTDTEVVEEPVIEEPPPVVMEPELSHHPLVADGSVTHGEINVDPKLLNSRGFHFQFTEPFARYRAWLVVKDGETLNWEATLAGEWDRRDSVWIRPIGNNDDLEYDTEYKLGMSFQDSDCDYTDIVIQFRTKPQRPVVGQPAPVIQERPPVVPLGEHFRPDIMDPFVVAANVTDGDKNVDPEPLNANGIHFEFDEPIKKYETDLRLHGGASLGWLPRGLADNDMGERIQITPAEGFPLLEFDTTYEIDVFILDALCRTLEFKIAFHTKPKP